MLSSIFVCLTQGGKTNCSVKKWMLDEYLVICVTICLIICIKAANESNSTWILNSACSSDGVDRSHLVGAETQALLEPGSQGSA